MDRLAIVVPCYNEEEMLPITTKELTEVLGDLIRKEKIAPNSYILYVDDGSKDATWELIEKLHKESDIFEKIVNKVLTFFPQMCIIRLVAAFAT